MAFYTCLQLSDERWEKDYVQQILRSHVHNRIYFTFGVHWYEVISYALTSDFFTSNRMLILHLFPASQKVSLSHIQLQ
jgi:hypothetical protein